MILEVHAILAGSAGGQRHRIICNGSVLTGDIDRDEDLAGALTGFGLQARSFSTSRIRSVPRSGAVGVSCCDCARANSVCRAVSPGQGTAARRGRA
jgi:hypothetical protein